MRITEKNEIDIQKLQKVVKERGHGIISDLFWEKLSNAFDSSFMEVHQCPCGEVLFTDINPNLPKDSNNNVLCKNCGEYKDEVVSYIDINIIDELVEKSRLYYEEKDKNKREIIFNEIKSLAKPWFPISSFQEFHFALNMHQHYISNYSEFFFLVFDIIDKLCKKAKSINNQFFKQIFYKINFSLMNSKLKAYWVERESLDKIINAKFNSNINLTGLESEYSNDIFQEELIRKHILLFRLRIENTEPLKFLANLVLVLNNKSPEDDPFPKNAKNSLAKKIEYVLNLPELTNLAVLIEKSHNTKLRNDDAHVQFEVLDKGKKILSRKNNVFYTDNEILQIYNQMNDFHEAFSQILHLNSEVEKWKGIKNLKFIYDFDKFESVLVIYQFYYFNEDGEFPEIKVGLNKEQCLFQIYFGEIIISHLIEDKTLLWYSKIIITKNFKIKLKLILPKLGYYKLSSKKEVEIDGSKFYLKNEITKTIRIQESFTELIRTFILEKGFTFVDEDEEVDVDDDYDLI